MDNRSPSTPHCGPIEGKILQGSDGRMYILEMMRLTTRDANFVHNTARGTNKLPVEQLAMTDKDIAVTYVLRQELINIFMMRKLNVARQQMLMEISEAAEAKLKTEVGTTDSAAASNNTDSAKESESVVAATSPSTNASTEEEESVVHKENAPANKSLTDPDAADEKANFQLAMEYTERLKDITPKSLGVVINPNCFLDFEFDVDPAVMEKDEAIAREMAVFLIDTVIPAVTRQVREGELQPKDGAGMVTQLHRMGINMRYLGTLATQAASEEKEDESILATGKQRVHSMPYFWRELLVIEMLARSAKHVLNSYYSNKKAFAAPAQTIASMLNYVLSLVGSSSHNNIKPTATEAVTTGEDADQKKKKKQKRKNNNKSSDSNDSSSASGLESTSSASLLSEASFIKPSSYDATESKDACLQLFVSTLATRFGFDLPLLETDPVAAAAADARDEAAIIADIRNNVDMCTKHQKAAVFLRTRISALTLLRRICQLCGIRIASRNYDMSSPTPILANDIISLIPITKSCEPDVLLPEFHELLSSSAKYLQQGEHGIAYELAQQAAGVITQVSCSSFFFFCHMLLYYCQRILLSINNRIILLLLYFRSLVPIISTLQMQWTRSLPSSLLQVMLQRQLSLRRRAYLCQFS